MSEITIFYAADLHGSDLCFKKWLNAAQFYGADVTVIGGDLTGKILVPVYPEPGGHRVATWHGRQHRFDTDAEVAEFARRTRAAGSYAFETSPDEIAEIQASIEKERDVFARLKIAALEEWISWADERLTGSSTRAFVMPGNDDPTEIDEVLRTSERLQDVHGRAVELAPGLWMASRGESTPTPWMTPREIPDEELGARVEKVVSEIPEGAVAIWNIHNPPFDTGVDSAPRLDEQLRIRYSGSGEPDMVPVGSRSVRALIEDRQPLLALHGHIHEGRGRYTLGRTVGFNPGSVYSDGVLYGVLVRVSTKGRIKSYTLTSG
jgi:Icc-related predicted phosphoesterase